MSQFNLNPYITRPANTDLSTKQNYFVKLTSGKVALAAAGTDKILGVLNNYPSAANQAATVQITGTAKVVASGAISALAYVTSDSAGKAVATTSSGDTVRGIALEAAAADGDIIEVLLTYFKY